VTQVEVSRQEDSGWPEQVTLAMKQEPDLLVCNPLKERQTTELALLAASRGAVLAVLHQPDAGAALRWLLRNGFRSPLKAGVLKGVLTVASVPRLCSNCKIPIQAADETGHPVTLYTRQGCELCMGWDGLQSEAVLEWLPLPVGAAPLDEAECTGATLRVLVEEAGGEPLAKRVLQRAKEGRIDGSEARDYLSGG
jgi:type II secretory ATPase GspE/PulE/Tfp pilus assembly ATPase PilB-like protein